jgi:serine/threonine-protein kinase
LKPANVLVNEDGRPIIIDFGLAKMLNRDAGLTQTGQLIGTPAYIAPEYASGNVQRIGPAADVYALGAILYFLCAGQPAFSGRTPFDVMLQVLDLLPPPPSKLNKRIDKQVDHVCLRSLEKDPRKRYRTAQQLARELDRLLTGEPIDCPREGLLARVQKWWQRDPILAAHVLGIGLTTAIVATAYWMRAEPAAEFRYRMLLLLGWLVASYILQIWVYRARWREPAILTWLGLDVVIYTTLIAFADQPRSMLLIGYPMMVVASGLFYQRRFLAATTAMCIGGFLLLGWLVPKGDFEKLDFSAIFVTGLVTISLCMASAIRRVRGLSRVFGDSRH